VGCVLAKVLEFAQTRGALNVRGAGELRHRSLTHLDERLRVARVVADHDNRQAVAVRHVFLNELAAYAPLELRNPRLVAAALFTIFF
jgi:hypothetical protein